MVDWELATSTARRLVRPGPALTPAQASEVTRELRTLADEALDHVVAYTGLEPQPHLRTTVEVVDRPTWAAYNVAGMRHTLHPFLERLAERRSQRSAGRTAHRSEAFSHASASAARAANRAGRAAIGVEIGSVLAFLASHVLGQYETFPAAREGDGRLLLVAPNIVDVQRRLAVDARDFRMWVCIHEQTHRVQFTAAPWIQTHLESLIRRLAQGAELDPRTMLKRLREARGSRATSGGPLAALQSPEQRAIIEEIQAFMTLLEGHADQVMDAVGPQVIPSVTDIRDRFEQRRRESGSPINRLVRKLLGVDAKMAQYRIGGAFCRAVTREGGTAAMRVAFAGPEYLPTMAELENPEAWLTRTAGVRL